jgi:hypothetical protein
MDARSTLRCRRFLDRASEVDILREIARPSRLVLSSAVIPTGQRVELVYVPREALPPAPDLIVVALGAGARQMQAEIAAARIRETPGRRVEARRISRRSFIPTVDAQADLFHTLSLIGAARLLGIETEDDLLVSDRIHFTRLVPYRVLVDGREHADHPGCLPLILLGSIMRSTALRTMRDAPEAVIAPLGGEVAMAVHEIGHPAGDTPRRVLSGLPDPLNITDLQRRFFWGCPPPRRHWSRIEGGAFLGRLNGLRDRVARALGG